jgi:hypothetical protein
MMYLLIIFIQLFFIQSDPINMTGTWVYQAPTAPPAYQEGEIQVSKDNDGNITVEVVFGEYRIPTSGVKVDKNKLSFSFSIEGAYIPLSLEFKGASFKGQADTPDGYVLLTGEKKKE